MTKTVGDRKEEELSRLFRFCKGLGGKSGFDHFNLVRFSFFGRKGEGEESEEDQGEK